LKLVLGQQIEQLYWQHNNSWNMQRFLAGLSEKIALNCRNSLLPLTNVIALAAMMHEL